MENNIKEKAKPKVTYKEVKRKMKKLTLTQKNRINEDKKEQKAKDKAEKQRVSQRVKININIPSSVNKSGLQTSVPLGPIFNPLNQSSREQISLLNSINEQLKNKNKPASINDMFKIPARTIETQTEPTQQYSQGSQTRQPALNTQGTDYEPTQQYSQGSQTRVKQREQSTQQEPRVNRVIETQTDEDFTQDMDDINNELQQRLAQTRLPEQFSPKLETPIPIIREPNISIISKPKEKSNEGLIEKVSKLTEEQLRAEEEALTQKMAASLMENPKMPDKEKKQRADARKEEVERQIDEAEARLVEELKEKVEKDIVKRKQPTGEYVSEKVKEIEARTKATDNRNPEKNKEKEQIKLVEAEYKRQQKEQKEQRGLDNAFNMLIQFSNLIEERKLTEAYNSGFLKKEDIRNKLKELKNSSTNKKIFTAKEIDEMFK